MKALFSISYGCILAAIAAGPCQAAASNQGLFFPDGNDSYQYLESDTTIDGFNDSDFGLGWNEPQGIHALRSRRFIEAFQLLFVLAERE